MATKKFDDTTDRNSRAIMAFLVLLVVLGFAAAGYFYMQTKNVNNDSTVTKQSEANRAKEVKAKVAKLISVPADETPTLASVTDKTKLKDQPFFKDAQNGDQILIFPQAKKAIIYREDENRLINVGPIAITSDSANKPKEEAKPPSGTESAAPAP